MYTDITKLNWNCLHRQDQVQHLAYVTSYVAEMLTDVSCNGRCSFSCFFSLLGSNLKKMSTR